MAFALENHHSSLLRFCNAFALEMQNQNQNLTVVDYEAHADVETLPKSDHSCCLNHRLPHQNRLKLVVETEHCR